MARHPESMLVLLDEIRDGRKSSCTAAWEIFLPREMMSLWHHRYDTGFFLIFNKSIAISMSVQKNVHWTICIFSSSSYEAGLIPSPVRLLCTRFSVPPAKAPVWVWYERIFFPMCDRNYVTHNNNFFFTFIIRIAAILSTYLELSSPKRANFIFRSVWQLILFVLEAHSMTHGHAVWLTRTYRPNASFI